MEFTPKLIEKAKNVTSAAEILALAKENGIDMTAEKAAAYFANLHTQAGKISDEELDNVAGGCDDKVPVCSVCGHTLVIGYSGMYGCPNKDCPKYGKD